MPVSSTVSRVQFTAPGGSYNYPVNFQFFNDTDLVVVTTEGGVDTTRTLGGDYTVSGGAGEDGAVLASFTAGATVTIYRAMPATQETEFQEGDALPADDLNDALDKLTMLVQQAEATLALCLRLPPSSTLTEIEFPNPETGKFLRWNEAADGLENADVLDGGGVSTATTATPGIVELDTEDETMSLADTGHAVTAVSIARAIRGAKLAAFVISR